MKQRRAEPTRTLFRVDDFLASSFGDPTRSYNTLHSYSPAVLLRILQMVLAEANRRDRDGDPVYAGGSVRHFPLFVLDDARDERFVSFEPRTWWHDLHLMLVAAFRTPDGPAARLGFRPGQKRYVSPPAPIDTTTDLLDLREAMTELARFYGRTLRYAPDADRDDDAPDARTILALRVRVAAEGFALNVEYGPLWARSGDSETGTFRALEVVAGESFRDFLVRVRTLLTRLVEPVNEAPWHVYRVALAARTDSAAGVYVLAPSQPSALEYVAQHGLLPRLDVDELARLELWERNVATLPVDALGRCCALTLHHGNLPMKRAKHAVLRTLKALAHVQERHELVPTRRSYE